MALFARCPVTSIRSGRLEYLGQQAEMSLRRFGRERIDLFQLHRIDPQVQIEDQLDVLVDLQ